MAMRENLKDFSNSVFGWILMFAALANVVVFVWGAWQPVYLIYTAVMGGVGMGFYILVLLINAWPLREKEVRQ